jgi:Tfp pilus assembly protein PilF
MDADTLFAQATEALKAKRNEEAHKLLVEVLRLDPRHEQAWLAMASVLTDMRQASDCLRRVLALNPNNSTAQEWLARASQELAREEAVQEMMAEPADSEQRPVPRLGEYLLDYKFITPEQLQAALMAQEATANGTRRLGDILLEQGAITKDRLDFALHEQHRSFYSLFDE